jgi:isoquinoline 1-oxidoreductase subunit beta
VAACAAVAASTQMGLGLGAPNDHTKIRVTNLLMGGGLGRKFESDFVAQAVQVGKHPAVIGKAVQTVWSREEDTGNDQYRPMTLGRIDAGVDANGKIVGWVSRNVSPSITVQRNTLATNDGQAIESLIRLPYDLGPRKVEWVRHTARPDVGFWRSVGAGMNVFIVESAIDEIALAEGKDPYLYRRSMLEHAEGARWLRVLDTAATMAGWGTRVLPATRKLGIAIGEAFATIVCHVVEVSVTAPNSVNVHNVWSAADCGTIVNPDTCKAQIEGAMVYGLSAGLWGKVTWKNGGTVEKNYNKSRKLKMAEMPKVEVTMLETPGVALGGLGEPGTPPIAPAVANAYAALTGVRIRTLPMFPAQSVMLDL